MSGPLQYKLILHVWTPSVQTNPSCLDPFSTNLHRTTLYTEYCLCKQLLRVCGAVPDREASEEELTESEEEEESVLEEDKVISHILHTVLLPNTAPLFTASILPLISKSLYRHFLTPLFSNNAVFQQRRFPTTPFSNNAVFQQRRFPTTLFSNNAVFLPVPRAAVWGGGGLTVV